MASLTDGLGQSIISRLAQPPDVTTGESGIPALFGGLSSGFQAGRQFVKDRRGFKAAKDEMSAMVGGKGISTRDAKAAGLVKPSFLEAFAGGMTRTPGVRAAGRDPNFSINQKIAEQNLRMNELQIQELMEQRENRVSTRETSLELGRYIASGIRSGTSNSPEFRAQLAETLARNPESLTDPRIVQQLRLLQQSQTIEQENEKLRRVPDIAPGLVPNQQTFETPTGTITYGQPPVSPKVFDLEGGGKAVQTGPNSFRVLEQEGAIAEPKMFDMKGGFTAIQSGPSSYRIFGPDEGEKMARLRSFLSDLRSVQQATDKAIANPDLTDAVRGPLLRRLRQRQEELQKDIDSILNEASVPTVEEPLQEEQPPVTPELPPGVSSNADGQPIVSSTGEVVERPSTQSEFDSLPKGTPFINPSDGRLYRKR